LKEATDLYRGVDFTVGIGVALVAGPQLVERFQTGAQERPEGVAVVCAAVDWQRAGLSRPVRRADLEAIYRPYLRRLRPRSAIGPQDVESGLSWASEPTIPGSDIALVNPADEAGETFRAFDYVVAYRDGSVGGPGPYQEEVPTETWDWIVRHQAPEALSAVGYSAYSRGRPDIALEAFTGAARSEIAEVSAVATWNRGALLGELGRSEEAVAAYDEVVSRFGEASEPALREYVAMALFMGGRRRRWRSTTRW
jgi:tetratricopeptide (TPR) repeat protein